MEYGFKADLFPVIGTVASSSSVTRRVFFMCVCLDSLDSLLTSANPQGYETKLQI